MAAALIGTLAVSAAEPLSSEQAEVARSEIINLFSWSVIAFDNKDYERFLTTFAPQSVFRVSDQDPKRNVNFSRADMVKNWSLRPGTPGGDQHFTSNLNVEFADERHAKLHGYYVWMKPNPTGAEGPLIPAGMGTYDVALIKIDGHWLFEDYHLLHAEAGKTP